MKIAISAKGTELDSTVDPRFGRASYFIIVDSDSGRILDVIDNSSGKEAPHGAGINAAALVAERGVDVVLTGRVGPKAFSVLSAGGIKVVSEMEGTVKEALERFLKEKPQYSKGPNGDGHFSG